MSATRNINLITAIKLQPPHVHSTTVPQPKDSRAQNVSRTGIPQPNNMGVTLLYRSKAIFTYPSGITMKIITDTDKLISVYNVVWPVDSCPTRNTHEYDWGGGYKGMGRRRRGGRGRRFNGFHFRFNGLKKVL